MSVKNEMDSALRTFAERNAMYGNNYKEAARVIKLIIPEPIEYTEDSINRFCIMVMVISKLMRYGFHFNEGGHYDSAHDLINYSAMLAELTPSKDGDEASDNLPKP